MPFDPDAYLAAPTAKAAFDPDAYLGGKQAAPDATNFMQRMGAGVMKPVEGLARMGEHVGIPGAKSVADTITEKRAEYNAMRGDEAGKFSGAELTGEVGAMLPLTMAMPIGSTLPRMAALGAAQGGVQGGLGAAATAKPDQFWSETAQGAGIGAALGGAASGIVGVGSRFISPNVSPEVQALMDKGVYPPPGQIIGGAAKRAEDAVGIGSRSGVAGEYTTAAINDALAPLGVTLPKGTAPGHAAVQEARNIVGKAYDDVWSATHRVTLDGQAANDLTGIVQQATQRLKKPELLDEFKGLVEDGLANVKGAVTADKIRAAVDGLRETAADYVRAGGPQATMGRLLNRIADTTEEAAVRSNPALSAAKSAADKAYAGMSRIFDASAKDVADGLITPRTLAAAVKSGAPSNQTVAAGQGLLQPIAAAGLKALPPAVNSVAPYAIGAGIGGAGVGASALTGDPKYAAMAGGLGLLYTPAGRRAFATTMTQRPDWARAMAEALRGTAPYATSAAAGAANR